jgi:lipopolysaccharide heptosyltransferase II
MARSTRMNSQRPKILTVQFKSLGDTVVSIPTLTAIRRRFPDCELHALVSEASVPLLQHHPAVNRVWCVPRTHGKAQFRAYWPIIRQLRAERFDGVVDLGGNDRSAIVMFLSGAPERLGALQKRGFFGKRLLFTHRVTPLPEDRHESLRLLRAVSPWNISPPEKIEINIYTDPAVKIPFQRDPSKRTVICHPGAACSKKQWPIAHWAKFHQLATTARGFDLVYTRGVSQLEEQLIQELQTLVPGAKILPKLDLPQLLAAIKSADAVISNDTGPMHFATGLGVKTVAIFGPSLHRRWYPIGAEHRLLLAANCECIWDGFVCRRANHCLAEIKPETVLENLESLLL